MNEFKRVDRIEGDFNTLKTPLLISPPEFTVDLNALNDIGSKL